MAISIVAGTGLLQAGILLVLLEAVRRRNIPAMLNAFVSLSATLVPLLLETAIRIVNEATVGFGPYLPFWIAAAGLLHSIGMLGPYDTVWWWDYLTHAISAGLVAALIFAGLIVTVPHSLYLSADSIPVLTVAFTVGVGVFWELIELGAREIGERFDIEPVLVHYSWRDTAGDLLVDTGAAVGVVAVDLRMFIPTAERFPEIVRLLVVSSSISVVVGSVALALLVGLSRSTRGSQ